MIVQVEHPPSSLLLQQRVREETGEEYLLITQIHNVHFTKLSEFESYFNEVNKGGDSPTATRRIVDSNFVVVPLSVLHSFLEHPD
jgi:hypothetical protein